MDTPSIKTIETVVFVPSILGSRLRKCLQEADVRLTYLIKKPMVWLFVERGGIYINRELGRPNPWSGEMCCDRQEYHHCQGRALV